MTDETKKKDMGKNIGLVAVTVVIMVLITSGYNLIQQSAIQHDQNLTAFAQNQTVLAIKYQMDSEIVQQGYTFRGQS